ncbi:hybrid sensor histidine kinase/response regulator [Thalassovita aquimarina]|uniref:histidine kinase n=1 Tax=Thalassovita aquimarina TaxID=2785917 RepID=A0ABS5HM24_9RHOB|nr:ATP-binding protein [Thalassovita aquimarina]MBR9649994.1 response regulator [Thalassovita aquimarina]
MLGTRSHAFPRLNERIRLSKFHQLQAAVLLTLWLGYFIWIGNTDLIKAALWVAAATLPACILHGLRWDYLARVYWNVASALAVLKITFSYGGDATPEVFFFFLIGFPFLLFSLSEERKTLISIVAFQTAIGFFALSMDFFGFQKGVPTPPLTEEQARTIEWGIRITVASLLLIQMMYSSFLNSRAHAQAKAALREANSAARTKGEFLANMSHEIRTPMNGVIGMIEILETMDLSPQQERPVTTIRNSAFALLRILDDILDASKIDAGKLNVEKTKVEIRPLLEGVSQTMQTMADEKGGELRLLIDRKLPEWVMADSGRLRQVLLNLLSNSIKYSAKNLTGHKGTVVLKARNHRDKLLVITVKDNGIGMSDEVKENLFEPFMQGEQSSRRRVGGTGLGLVISKNLIHLMGGDIRIESEEGEGTKAVITLPLEPADGPSRLPDLTGLQVVCFGVKDELIREGMEHILGAGGVQNEFIDDMEYAERQAPDRMNRAVIIFPPMDATKRDPLQKRFEELFPGASFIHCSPVRSDRLGLIAPNTYRIQIFPMITSELYHALAELSGRVARASETAEHDTAGTGPDHVPGDHRILVVEDNEINKAVLSKQLEILGYPHELASDGMEGFAKWQMGDFSLVLTDCHMPRMDGFEMLAAIRTEERQADRQRLPVIAITANALQGEAAKCIAAGMDGYLAKPVELKALESQILALLNNRQELPIAS